MPTRRAPVFLLSPFLEGLCTDGQRCFQDRSADAGGRRFVFAGFFGLPWASKGFQGLPVFLAFEGGGHEVGAFGKQQLAIETFISQQQHDCGLAQRRGDEHLVLNTKAI